MAKSRQTEIQVQAPAPLPAPGVYHVRLEPYPRRLIDTGLPAGEAAEAVARDRYLDWLGLQARPGRNVIVEPVG